jgi:hypothetical protein
MALSSRNQGTGHRHVTSYFCKGKYQSDSHDPESPKLSYGTGFVDPKV